MKRYSVATSCMMESPRNSILWLCPLDKEAEREGETGDGQTDTIQTDCSCSRTSRKLVNVRGAAAAPPPAVEGSSLIKENFRSALQMWAGAAPGRQEAEGGGEGSVQSAAQHVST